MYDFYAIVGVALKHQKHPEIKRKILTRLYLYNITAQALNHEHAIGKGMLSLREECPPEDGWFGHLIDAHVIEPEVIRKLVFGDDAM